jgi:hypothetical protein
LLHVIEFAERQILDVHGSGVLDARKQRMQLLSEPASSAPTSNRRHHCNTTSRSHSSRTARRRPRAEHATTRTPPPTTQPGSTNAGTRKARCVACVAHEQPAACWPIMSSARGDPGNVSRQ